MPVTLSIYTRLSGSSRAPSSPTIAKKGSVRSPICHNSGGSLRRCLNSSGCLLTIPWLRHFSTIGLPTASMIAVQPSTRWLSTKPVYPPMSLPILKPINPTPSKVLPRQQPRYRDIKCSTLGLRPDPIKDPLPTNVDAYKESAVVLHRPEAIRVRQQKLSEGLLRRVSLQIEAEQLTYQFHQSLTHINSSLPDLIDDNAYELVTLEERLCETVSRFITTSEEEIVKAKNERQLLIAKAQHRQLIRWQASWIRTWADTESVLVSSAESNRKITSYISSKISRLFDEYLEWYRGLLRELSRYFYERPSQYPSKFLLYRIHTAVLDLCESTQQITDEAHIARHYDLASLHHRVAPDAFRYKLKYTLSDEIVHRLNTCCSELVLHAESYGPLFWRRTSSDGKLRQIFFPTRFLDLCYIMKSNGEHIELCIREFFFGVLSNDCAPAMQLRRAQAAALAPFWTAFREITATMKKISKCTKLLNLRGQAHNLDQYSTLLAVDKRTILESLDLFAAANWWSNKHRLSTRTVFMKRPSQSARMSPVLFNMLPERSLRPNWTYNDYVGPQGETVAVIYARDVSEMDDALAHLQHNGVVSLDVRWAPPDNSLVRTWFGNDVAVITLSSQSQIVVCHLAKCDRLLLHQNIPDSLRQLLESPTTIKVGMNIDKLQERLVRCMGISMAGTCDIGSFDVSVESILSTEARHRPSDDLKSLVSKHFEQHLPSCPHVKSSWLHDFSLFEFQCRLTHPAAVCS